MTWIENIKVGDRLFVYKNSLDGKIGRVKNIFCITKAHVWYKDACSMARISKEHLQKGLEKRIFFEPHTTTKGVGERN